MEASSGFLESSLSVPDIMILQVFEENEDFHHLIVDGQDKGRIDWEESPDGKTGYIDGLDAEQELLGLPNQDLAWMVIASCMYQHHPKVRRIQNMYGVIELIED